MKGRKNKIKRFKTGIIYNDDNKNIFPLIEDNSINLIVTDPPYNIGKAEWDNIPDYVSWCGNWIKECERLLKYNGSFYFFQNDIETISELMCWIRNNTNFIFRNLIVWNKKNFRAISWKNPSNKNNLRSWFQTCEYILFYTFQDGSGLKTLFSNKNCFLSIKSYLRDERKKAKEAGFSTHIVTTKILGLSNKSKLYGHFTDDSQWIFPTKEMYKKLQQTGFFKKEYEDLREEYESLRKEHESLRYTFNLQGNDNNIIEINSGNRNRIHPTQKPIELIEKIILHSSNENDLIFDCFSGSGTTAIACINTNRNFICCEQNKNYYEKSLLRVLKYETNKSI